MKTRLSPRFFRLLLHLYPRTFREAYGPRMEEAFLASLELQSQRFRGFGVAFTWIRVSWDTLVHATDLRFGRGSLGTGRLSASGQDLRLTVRSLGRSPSFSVTFVLIAALGISLMTLAFTAVNATFLRPLPSVRSPEELVRVSRELPSRAGRRSPLSYGDFARISERSSTLYDMVGVIPFHELILRTGSGPDRAVIGGEVTANYFAALGIPMVLGRGILPADADSDAPVAVLGHATWTREFGGRSDALGRLIRVDGRPYTIVGVAPPGLGWLSGEPVESAVWIPLRKRYREAEGWDVLDVAGRHRPEVTLAQVQADLDALASGLVETTPERWTGRGGSRVGLRAMTDRQARLDLVGGPRGMASVVIYLVFIGLIMIITCSNVASLLLNRALRRRSEIALRLALGAGRGRLILGILTESLILFLLAGFMSVLLIQWGTQLLARGLGAFFPAAVDITVDARVTIFALGITVFSGFAFGLGPALQATRLHPAPTLKGDSGGILPSRLRIRKVFVLAQVAGAMALVSISGLLVRDLQKADELDIGFDPAGVLVASLDLSHGDYSVAEGRAFLTELTERVEGIPGVERVALSSWVPLSGSRWTEGIRPHGYEAAENESLRAAYNAVSPGYFEMVGMTLVTGRDFEGSDDADAPGVVIVNQAFARRYWPDQEPLGKRVAVGGGDDPGSEVVGVVRDAMYTLSDFRARASEPHVWAPRAQRYHEPVQLNFRALGEQGPVLSVVREEVSTLNRDLPILALTTMEHLTDRAFSEERAGAALFGGLSATALLLAALGIYGVMAHSVVTRTRELGVRLAVGATPSQVVGMVLSDTLRASALGIGMGLGLAVLAGLGIRALLVGVSTLDPLSMLGSVTVLVLAAVAAGLAPALRAARLDPVVSLRSE